MTIYSIKTKKDFNRIKNSNLKIVTKTLVLISIKSLAAINDQFSSVTRISYIITKNIHKNSTIRNKIKRRFKNINLYLFKLGKIRIGYDYLVIARNKITNLKYSQMEKELKYAFSKIDYTKNK